MTVANFTPQQYPLFELRPILDGSPELNIWTGAISYHETRQQAGAAVKEVEKAGRGENRRHEVSQLLRRLTGAKDTEESGKES
ncbi:hypothetical protein [Actinomadura gamaensis]|uniref:DUF5753 domain-containing protein n=1 Tax=Actinomadura gamaensis TaxID=1763541 RepID=A0ABV9U6S2_9ACTN